MRHAGRGARGSQCPIISDVDGLDFARLWATLTRTRTRTRLRKREKKGQARLSERKIEILALVGDQYQFQLARPTWQALSFLYQRTAIAPFLAEGAPIVPGGARVMAACFELTDLHVSMASMVPSRGSITRIWISSSEGGRSISFLTSWLTTRRGFSAPP